MKRIRFSLNKQYQRYIAEMFLIVLSVLLAFSLNELKNNQREKKKLETSLKFIQEEITQNQDYVNEAISVHRKIMKKIDSLIDTGNTMSAYTLQSGFAYQNIYKGSYFKQLLSYDAWKIANNNNVLDKMDIHDILWLSRVYEQQNLVMDAVFQISDFLQTETIFDKGKVENNCKLLRNHFNVLYGRELRLQKNYIEAQKILSAHFE